MWTRVSNIALALAVGLALPTAAFAQAKGNQQVDPSARASYGDYRLNAGFPDDPYIIYVTAGGDIDASNVADGCAGMVAYAPDAQLTYRAGSFPLIIRTEADRDTTLLINGPDGSWYCDDDSGGSLNAELRWGSPPSGVYDIWVGTFGGGTTPAELRISELDGGPGPNNGYPDASLPATYGSTTLRGGFTPDPYRVRLTAGGSLEASQLGSGCVGRIAGAPDYELSYRATSFDLTIGVNSSTDTTLVVNGPDGRWYCDDDGADAAFNPLIRFNDAQSGTYDIWVGTYGDDTASAELYISELGED
jgi:hypothetical protein